MYQVERSRNPIIFVSTDLSTLVYLERSRKAQGDNSQLYRKCMRNYRIIKSNLRLFITKRV